MKKIVQLFMMLFISLMATSCYYDELPAEAVGPLPASVSYKNDIQPLFNQNCIACHKAGATTPDLTSANSYAALTTANEYVIPTNAAGSILYKALTGNGAPLMPPSGGLSAAKIALVEKWITDGALNN